MSMSPRLLRPRATGFDPRSIANLTGWFDATDSTSYTESSGQVSEWRDKSGSSNHISQSTANNRPTLFESASDTQNATRSTIGGKQAIFFDGANDILATANTVTSSQSRTVIAVARRTSNSPAAASTLAALGTSTTTAANRWLCRYGIAGALHVGGDSSTTNQNISSLPSGWTSGHIACWSQTSSNRNLSYFLNGTSFAITGNPPVTQTAFAGLTIGATPINGSFIQFMNGHIGEILIYDRELSESERSAATRGLASKWGISLA